MKKNNLRIAIDGAASTGKSTIAKMLSKELGIGYINTGEMYRYITYFAIENNLLNKWRELVDELSKYNVIYKDNKITSSWKGFKYNKLHTALVAEHASNVSASPEVREYATKLQKNIAKKEGILLEGRDIGTVIMPDADFKFFLTVSEEEAANRRYIEYNAKGIDITYNEVLTNLRKRNFVDSTREVAPLLKANDAFEIDTSKLSKDEVFNKIMSYIKNEK